MYILCSPRIRSVLLALAVCAGPVPLHAQSIYQSVDPQGHTVFSDRPQGPGAEQKIVNDAASPPKMAHFCWTNCFTLVESHGIYSRVDGTDETWTVERFTSTSFVLTRHDPSAQWNGFKTEVRYTGRVVDERLVDVTVDGTPTSDIRMAWGGAIDTLPGSNAERDRLQAQGLWPPADTTGVGEDAPSLPTATEAPPPLPMEEQPPCELEGSIWTPGYWAWKGGYYWAPGAWVPPPRAGLLWTPGYWVLTDGVFVFHRGFWGPAVGDYGGINYGHGYFGAGYTGGRWVGDRFHYNAAVSNIDERVIHGVYREPVPAGVPVARVSYVGSPSGTASLVLHRARVTATKPLATSQPVAHEPPPQVTANGSPTPTAHHRKSRSDMVSQAARNSATTHSRVTVEPPAVSTPALPSTAARASH